MSCDNAIVLHLFASLSLFRQALARIEPGRPAAASLLQSTNDKRAQQHRTPKLYLGPDRDRHWTAFYWTYLQARSSGSTAQDPPAGKQPLRLDGSWYSRKAIDCAPGVCLLYSVRSGQYE